MEDTPPRILVIAGSDSSGGAGVQADIKTITMLSGYAMSAITAITAQNTRGVQAVEVLSPELVAAQIDACLEDIGADVVKIGMLGSPAIAALVAERLAATDHAVCPVVFDPVMVATSGAVLADRATIAGFEPLMALARLVTPNLPELAALTGRSELDSIEAVTEAAALLAERHDCAVLAKGGHAGEGERGAGSPGERVFDVLVDPDGRAAVFEDSRIDTRHTHGTGCTLASAIATLLGHGQPLEHAVRLARRFVREALVRAPGLGEGAGPLGHQAVSGARA